MRKLAVMAVGLVLACVAYALWPIASALQIKQAVKSSDVTTIERLVRWKPVRASLKASLAHLPAMQIAGDERRLIEGQAMPSIWARIKSATAPIMIERLVDTYVTAEGVTQLHLIKRGDFLSALGLISQTPRSVPQASASGTLEADAPTTGSNGSSIASRVLNFYDQLISAKFHSLSLAEFEIADTAHSGRRIVSQFALTKFEWKLVSVRILGVGL